MIEQVIQRSWSGTMIYNMLVVTYAINNGITLELEQVNTTLQYVNMTGTNCLVVTDLECLLLPDYILGPEEDLTGVVIDDEAGAELELALNKTRKLKQKKNRCALADRVLESAAHLSDTDEPQGGTAAAIILNATSEFCRSLGEIPSYGQAGNRGEDEEVMVSPGLMTNANTFESAFKYIRDPKTFDLPNTKSNTFQMQSHIIAQ